MPAHLLLPSYVNILAELLTHGNRTREQLSRRSGITPRMTARTIDYMRRLGMVQTVLRPLSYELTDNFLASLIINKLPAAATEHTDSREPRPDNGIDAEHS